MLGIEISGLVVYITICPGATRWVIFSSAQFIKVETLLGGSTIAACRVVNVGGSKTIASHCYNCRRAGDAGGVWPITINAPNTRVNAVYAVRTFVNIGDLEEIIASGIEHLFKLCCA